jgi:nicotinate-nucleotide adenylyltransferase
MRIGLLGGSFNPAHKGHLHASERALALLHLDYVWWLVSPQNPLKSESSMLDFGWRLAGARKAARHSRIRVSDAEAQLGTRYTIDSMRALQLRFPNVRFVWIIGSDNLLQLPRWRSWQALLAAVPIAVVSRPGTALAARTGPVARRFARALRAAGASFAKERPPAITVLDGPRNKESATRIRSGAG